MAFGHEIGIGIEEATHTHVPTEVTIKHLGNNEELDKIYTRYNTSIAIDTKGRIFMWGEDSFNMRLRKPKYFYTIQNGVK